jgi:hypothetical protein
MLEPDLSGYFAEFEPSPGQMKKLTAMVRRVHHWWGVEFGDAVIRATIEVAPGMLRRLSPGAVDLLRRCQGRTRAFNVRLDAGYDSFHRQTYRELFGVLLSCGLITDVSALDKLAGSTTVPQLRAMLHGLGVSTMGEKAQLVDRYASSVRTADIDNLVAGVVLYRATDAGDAALTSIRDLEARMDTAFNRAVSDTSRYYETQADPAPVFPPGVLFEDDEVRITEEDVDNSLDALADLAGSSLLRAPGRQMAITEEAITAILSEIETLGAGMFIITRGSRDEAPFVQGAILESGPESLWQLEVSKDVTQWRDLGFSLSPEDMLPLKRLSVDVSAIVFRTAIAVLGVAPGGTVYMTVDR